jgi:hypothetical protein
MSHVTQQAEQGFLSITNCEQMDREVMLWLTRSRVWLRNSATQIQGNSLCSSLMTHRQRYLYPVNTLFHAGEVWLLAGIWSSMLQVAGSRTNQFLEPMKFRQSVTSRSVIHFVMFGQSPL